MIAVQGTIEKIKTENNNGREKKVVTLQMGRHNTLFIEFQGKQTEAIKNFREGQKAEITIRFNGKTSQLGRNYNNIIAKSIKSV